MPTIPFSLPSFVIQHITDSKANLTITACATNPTALCPACQHISHRVHSYYTRSPQDLPISGRRVQLVLRVRRFRCQNRQCRRQTFAERLPEVPVSARQTTRLATILESIAIVLSGQAGSQLTAQLGMPVSADSLLRRAKKTATTSLPIPRILAVDDFAFRRGRTYGTLLLDWESHHPVDVLSDRSAKTFADWLKEHKGVQVIIRDRSTEYLRGASEGAPEAQQVLDRWHVMKNLREALERFLNRLHPQLRSDAGRRQKRTRAEEALSQGSRLRRLELYEHVVAGFKAGGSILGLAKEFHLSRQTVRKFVQASSFPERGKARSTRSAIDPYRSYLTRRWREGCHATDQLWQELQERGFGGSWMMVYRWVQLQQTAAPSLLVSSENRALGAPRQLAWLLLRDPSHLDAQEQQILSLICRDTKVHRAYQLAQHFVKLMKEQNAQAVSAWLLACLDSEIGELGSFALGLQKEVSALQAALTFPYSNGPIEGKITKLKWMKRSTYGRGSFELLRQKVLKAG